MELTICTPERTTTYQQVTSLTLPGLDGELEILPGHAEAFILLSSGTIAYSLANGQKQERPVTEGQCHIADDKITLLLP